jgi:sulfite oxidase
LKSIITQPENGDEVNAGVVTVLGAAYAGESDVKRIEISTDNGATWAAAEFIGPHEPYAWRQWQYLWQVEKKGAYTLLARATDAEGNLQPMQAEWNVLGYGNNGVREHGVDVRVK